MKALLALYPAAWRRRYGNEFLALLHDQPPSLGTFLDVVLGAIDAHLDPQAADDLEGSVRRRIKEVIVSSLSLRTARIGIVVLVPFVLLLTSYTNPGFPYLGLA